MAKAPNGPAGRVHRMVIARFSVEKRKTEHAEKMQAHDDDCHAGDLAEQGQVFDKAGCPASCRGRAKRHEYRGENPSTNISADEKTVTPSAGSPCSSPVSSSRVEPARKHR